MHFIGSRFCLEFRGVCSYTSAAPHSSSSTGTVYETVCGWDHGGTRYISTSPKLHT